MLTNKSNIALVIALSLAGCAAQPVQTLQVQPTTQEIPQIDPRFLDAAVPMEPVTYTTPQPQPQINTTRNLPLDQCQQLIVNQLAFAMTTTTAINTCLALPKDSTECKAVLIWNELRPTIIGGSDDEIMACANKMEAAGVPFPPTAPQVAREFERAVKRYKLKLGV